MDRRGEQLSEQSRRVLAAGRRIASQLGATLYALAPETDGDNDRWIAESGEGGADKVVLLSGSFAAEEVSAGTISAGVAAVVSSLKPRLILLAEGAGGRQLSGALATQIDAIFMSDVTVVSKASEIYLSEWTCGRSRQRTIALGTVQVPIVATVSTANIELQRGEDDADVIFFKAPPKSPRTPRLLKRENDQNNSLDAEIIVCAGLGAAHCLPLVDELARALGGVRASTKTLWLAGLAEEHNVVDWECKRVSPSLYLICGASGSAGHLNAISSGSHLITLGNDPLSAAMRAARYALLGDLSQTLPVLTHKADALAAAGGKR